MCQMGGVIQWSVQDATIALSHHIRTGWSNKKVTSVLAFDIAQFFPSLNHSVLISITDRFGFNDKVVQFFSNYLVDRKTKYSINGNCSDMYDSNVGVGQGSVLSPILSTLYISPIFHMLNLWVANHYSTDRLSLLSFLSFVDDGLLIASDISYIKVHDTLRDAYTHILSLFRDFGLIMEHSKTELFNFAWSSGDTRLQNPSMNLGFAPFTGENCLVTKKTWQYLGVFFNCNLTFWKHIKFYATKLISTVRCMRVLGNSM
jgi:hypothetical protein